MFREEGLPAIFVNTLELQARSITEVLVWAGARGPRRLFETIKNNFKVAVECVSRMQNEARRRIAACRVPVVPVITAANKDVAACSETQPQEKKDRRKKKEKKKETRQTGNRFSMQAPRAMSSSFAYSSSCWLFERLATASHCFTLVSVSRWARTRDRETLAPTYKQPKAKPEDAHLRLGGGDAVLWPSRRLGGLICLF